MENQLMTVNFQGTVLYGLQVGGNTYVALKPIVDALGLDWEGQRQKIQRDPILAEGTFITKVPSGKGLQDTLCLLLDYLNGWLFKIQTTRITDENLRNKVQAFQRECFQVLNRHFSGDQEASDKDSLSLRMVTECRHVYGERAAAQLWEKQGLPMVPAMNEAVEQLEMFCGPKRSSVAAA
jgi:hypothetical protein